jgi:hypothetical protein
LDLAELTNPFSSIDASDLDTPSVLNLVPEVLFAVLAYMSIIPISIVKQAFLYLVLNDVLLSVISWHRVISDVFVDAPIHELTIC